MASTRSARRRGILTATVVIVSGRSLMTERRSMSTSSLRTSWARRHRHLSTEKQSFMKYSTSRNSKAARSLRLAGVPTSWRSWVRRQTPPREGGASISGTTLTRGLCNVRDPRRGHQSLNNSSFKHVRAEVPIVTATERLHRHPLCP